jgi:cytoskeletal protein CcmA (bactofilin family)
MQDLKIDGMGTIPGGVFGLVKIDGMAKCTGEMKADTLDIDGMFTCRGDITAGVLDCDGMATVTGNIHAQSISIEGMLTIKGGTRLESGSIKCEGMIKIDGEVSADNIDAEGFIMAGEIVGDSIRIRSFPHRSLFFLFRPSRSRISLIEATEVDLRGVVADTVNGKDVRIGPGCRIENLDCSGTLTIHAGARVGRITGEYRQGN